ncbi:Thioredoxin F-type [Hibiscus syriacus]|uniref:Thioredoxin F-type n=1 Tax=Hibiscus syriacus TaxID=106335 RepID=A0A6A2YPF7_HIBSY|nr:thioredoxin F-type, chloroplastic-like [Hibiscus syriacus]KAE8681260.1 Thioredoxin F-type [Hibiscus syriacus]
MSLLQSAVSTPLTVRSSPSLSGAAAHSIVASCSVSSTWNSSSLLRSSSLKTVTSISSSRTSKRKGAVGKVRSSLETAGATVGQVTEVTKDTFWPIVKAAEDKTVVLDMYTQWCGPCKVIAPKYQELSEKYLDVVFLKLDCNQENKPLAKELGIRVVPTFKILKHNKVVKEVTGAKFDDLVSAIETVRSS